MDTNNYNLHKKALAGDAVAMIRFADNLRVGLGVKKNEKEAEKWLEEFLKVKKKFSSVDYIWIYYWGAVTAWKNKDISTAIKRFKKSFNTLTQTHEKYNGDELNHIMNHYDFHKWFAYLLLEKDLAQVY